LLQEELNSVRVLVAGDAAVGKSWSQRPAEALQGESFDVGDIRIINIMVNKPVYECIWHVGLSKTGGDIWQFMAVSPYIVQCKQSCIAWLTGLLRMDPMLNWNYTRTHLLLPSESAFQLGRASASFCATVRHAPSNHLISVHTSEPEIYSRKVKVWAMNCISSIVILRQISVSDPTTCFHIS